MICIICWNTSSDSLCFGSLIDFHTHALVYASQQHENLEGCSISVQKYSTVCGKAF